MLFPLLLGGVCLGFGQLVARVAGVAIPAPLLLPAGLAAVIVTGSFTTAVPALAPTTVWVVGIGAVAGLSLVPRRRPGTDALLALAAAVATLVLFGAPVLLTGEPTFAGYVKLDDTATFLAFADHVLDHGRDVSGLEPSTYEATLSLNIANGYPIGAIVPLGVGARLLHTDPLWLWQPLLSFGAALLTMALFALVRPVAPRPAVAAIVATLATSSAVFYAFAQWGGVKEILAIPLLAVAAATLPASAARPRAAIAPAVGVAGFLSVTSIGGIPWVAPVALAYVIVSRHDLLRRTLVGFAAVGVATLPTLVDAFDFLRRDNVASLRASDELGNLARPLRVRQVLGIWPTTDFRFDPAASVPTLLLIVAAAIGLILGLVLIVRRRAWALCALLAGATSGLLLVTVLGSPWLEAKATAMASPVVVAVALLGLVSTSSDWWRPTLVGLAVLVGAGILWSDVQSYRGAWLGPHDQLAELEQVGERFAGQGPALMTEFQPYGARHLLRRLDAEGASELRRRPVPLRDGRILDEGEFADTDELEVGELTRSYPLLVLRRSPVASRPPGAYALVWRGDWYEVWRRTRIAAPHLALGGPLHPAAVPNCRAVEAFAVMGPVNTRPVTPTRRASVVAPIPDDLPQGWISSGPGTGLAAPAGSAPVRLRIRVPRAGFYGLWLGGSIAGSLHVALDGRAVSVLDRHINQVGMWRHVTDVRLDAGAHSVELQPRRARFAPGAAAGPFYLGPVALAEAIQGSLTAEPPNRARLCGRALDWIELRLMSPS